MVISVFYGGGGCVSCVRFWQKGGLSDRLVTGAVDFEVFGDVVDDVLDWPFLEQRMRWRAVFCKKVD